MPLTNEAAIAHLEDLLQQQERTYAWLARTIGKSYVWVFRRFNGDTPMRVDDYGLMLRALDGNLATV